MSNKRIVICGAGIVGITLARELLKRGAEHITILEKESRLGAHASGRNSGVLHAGIYYPPGSLKARSCLEGNRRMKAYCREHTLPLHECGKVIVARNESELPTLDELFTRATSNGAHVEMIDPGRLKEIEPNAKTTERAILAHDTAVVDPIKILEHLRNELLADDRVTVSLNHQVTGRLDAQTLKTSKGPLPFDLFINAAGAWADRIAHHFDIAHDLRMIPFKGTYRKLKPGYEDFVRGNIYPVPDIRNPFLGVHLTRNIHGDISLGPTAIPAFGRANYGIFEGMDAEALSIFWRDVVLFCANPKFRQVALTEPRKYRTKPFHDDASALVHNLPLNAIAPSPKVGIRPQLVNWHTRELMMDFHIMHNENSLHILNAISPAFTCSLHMAEKIASESPDSGFSPKTTA